MKCTEIVVLALLTLFVPFLGSTTFAKGDVAEFVKSNCLDCHSGNDSEAGVNLSQLLGAKLNSESLATWVKVHDQVASGEMPPKEHDQPKAKDVKGFLSNLKQELNQFCSEKDRTLGRTVYRRLSNSEFVNTLSDLFQMPQPVADLLPAETTRHGFTNIGEAKRLSYVQLDSYLKAIDVALDRATVHIEKPERKTWKLTYNSNPWFVSRGLRQPVRFYEDGVEIFARENFAWLSATLEQWTVPHQGRYRIAVRGRAIRSKTSVPITVRAGGSGFHGSFTGATTTLGFFDMNPGESKTVKWEGWLERGRYIHVYPTTLPIKRFGAGERGKKKNLAYDGPGVVIESVEIEGPFFDQWPPPSHRVLYGDLPLEPIKGATPNPDPNQHLESPPKGMRNRLAGSFAGPAYPKARPGKLVDTHQIKPRFRRKAAAKRIAEFAKQAYRRPIHPDELKSHIDLVLQWLDKGSNFEEAMRIGFKSVLTSPGFLFFDESAGKLDDFALASRLSYFLTAGPPDEKLLQLAASGKLGNPVELRNQTERLLSNKKQSLFVRQFLDQWLRLSEIDLTSPDLLLYPEFDALLRNAMLEETYLMFEEMLERNLPVQNFIDSKFTFLNARLAEHYGIEGVQGTEMQKISLAENSSRGGLLTMGSVLKVTANGTTTSPIVRGIWVLENIIGEPPSPPPPGVPAVEPDIRGAKTIREQLAKHRSIDKCASCHKKIDPPGFALEGFDPIGGERSNYRVVKGKTPSKLFSGLLLVHYKRGPKVETAYETATGEPFGGIKDYKQILLSDQDMIVRTVVSKLMTYGTGAEISFADREVVEKIVKQVDGQNDGLRSIIHAIVQSETFRNK